MFVEDEKSSAVNALGGSYSIEEEVSSTVMFMFKDVARGNRNRHKLRISRVLEMASILSEKKMCVLECRVYKHRA
jgi:hypothetical protein